MTISISAFRTRYPEFSNSVEYSDARIQIFLDDSDLEISESIWGTLYERGIYSLTAHLLTKSTESANGGSGNIAGPLSAKKVGDIALSFSGSGGSGSSTEDGFRSTVYGAEYWRLLLLVGPKILAVGRV